MLTTASPLAKRIPRTPPEVREAERRLFTSKRIDWPLRVPSRTSSLSVARETDTSSSCGGKSIAIKPLLRTTVNFSTGVFLTSPNLVAITIKVPFIRPVVATIAVTFSPSAMDIRLIIDKPLEVRVEPAGIFWHLRDRKSVVEGKRVDLGGRRI